MSVLHDLISLKLRSTFLLHNLKTNWLEWRAKRDIDMSEPIMIVVLSKNDIRNGTALASTSSLWKKELFSHQKVLSTVLLIMLMTKS